MTPELWDYVFGACFVLNIPLFYWLGRISRNREVTRVTEAFGNWETFARATASLAHDERAKHRAEIARLQTEKHGLLVRCGEITEGDDAQQRQ